MVTNICGGYYVSSVSKVKQIHYVKYRHKSVTWFPTRHKIKLGCIYINVECWKFGQRYNNKESIQSLVAKYYPWSTRLPLRTAQKSDNWAINLKWVKSLDSALGKNSYHVTVKISGKLHLFRGYQNLAKYLFRNGLISDNHSHKLATVCRYLLSRIHNHKSAYGYPISFAFTFKEY